MSLLSLIFISMCFIIINIFLFFLVVPSAPGRVVATRNTKTSVVVQWDKPKHEENLYGYYIDYSVVGSNQWEPANHKPINYNRYSQYFSSVFWGDLKTVVSFNSV